jgi:hypothetical protein
MPLKFWGEAFCHAVYLINRLPSKVIDNQTPFLRLYGKEPEYTDLRVFGSACWPNLRPFNTRKLEFRSKQCVFLGFSNLHKGYKCLEPKEGHVYISRDVVFDESVFPFASLHPNARARLRAEILLLPKNLHNSGGTNDCSHGMGSPESTDALSSCAGHSNDAEANLELNDQNSRSGAGLENRHLMCRCPGDSSRIQEDIPGVAAAPGGGSPSGSVLSPVAGSSAGTSAGALPQH